MVQFNELTITSDGKYLIIDVSIPEESYFENTYLSKIVIDNQDTYLGNGPSSKAVTIYEATDGAEDKHARVVLDASALNALSEVMEVSFSLSDMFFVYVSTNGNFAPDIPCDMDKITTMGTVVNAYPYYQQGMNYIKELGSNCNIPQAFINHILQLKALETSVKTGNYPDAIKYYNKFFKGKGTFIQEGGCGCGNT